MTAGVSQVAASTTELEREAEGRYVVRVDGLRVGMVLGGNGIWLAETLDGAVVARSASRKRAAQELVPDRQPKPPSSGCRPACAP